MAKLRTIAANKEWLSLEEAAKELSHPLGEEVNEEDLWRFAQSNMLTISILNNSQALKYAHFCKTYDIFDHSETDKMLYDLLSKTKNAYKALLTIIKFNEPAPTLGRCFNGQWLGISEDADSTIESLILDLILIPNTFFNYFLEALAQPHLQHDYDWLFHKELFCFMPEEEVLKRFKPYFESNLNKPITISKCDKEKKIPNTDDFLYFTENNEIFALNMSDLTTTLEVKKTGFVAHINENDIAYEGFLPFVIRPENLQAFLDTLSPEPVLEPEANTPISTESKKQPAWNYRKPRSENEINMAIYNALVVAHKQEIPNPKDLISLMPIINKQGALGDCQIIGGNVYFHLEKDKSRRSSRTTKSIKNTISDLLKA